MGKKPSFEIPLENSTASRAEQNLKPHKHKEKSKARSCYH